MIILLSSCDLNSLLLLLMCSVLWGDSGYMRVRMGARDCGITTNAGYPGLVVPKPDRSEVARPLLSKER